MHRLQYEIREQPERLANLLESDYASIARVANDLNQRHINHVTIAARGTSDNAATYAKYLLGHFNQLPVALAAPSLHTLYASPPNYANGLVIGISQSGQSPDIVTVVKDAKMQGVPTLAITNAPDSPLASVAEYVLPCQAGEERSVAATKSYTTELAVLAMLSVALSGDSARLAALRKVPEAVQAALATQETVASAAERYRYMSTCAVIGRGFNYATAFELALKVKELTYVRATPYSSADFMHGPIAIIEPGYPVLLVAPSGTMYPDMLALAQELEQRGAEMLIISDRTEILEHAEKPIQLTVSVGEWLSPIVNIVPGQLFAYHLALIKNLDPEHPRGLHKVTETR